MDVVLRVNCLVEELISIEEAGKGHSTKLKECWTTPPNGWWKINIDAAFINGRAGLVFIARDNKGNILQLASKLVCCVSPEEAELKALVWAASVAAALRWDQICWSSDLSLVVNGVINQEEPSSWTTRYYMLFLISLVF